MSQQQTFTLDVAEYSFHITFLGSQKTGVIKFIESYSQQCILQDYIPNFLQTEWAKFKLNSNIEIFFKINDVSNYFIENENLKNLMFDSTNYLILIYSPEIKNSFKNLRNYLINFKKNNKFIGFILIKFINTNLNYLEQVDFIELKEIDNFIKEFNILTFLECDLNNLNDINKTFENLFKICYLNKRNLIEPFYKTVNINGLNFIQILKTINLIKTEEIIKYLDIENYKDLYFICLNYDKLKYSTFRMFFKYYKDLNLVYEVIIKFITLHFIKIYTNKYNIIDKINLEENTMVKNDENFIKNDDVSKIFLNILQLTIKEFNNKFLNDPKLFEISSINLSKFISLNIVKFENLMKSLIDLPFTISNLKFLMEDNSYNKWNIYLTIKNVNYQKNNNEYINNFINNQQHYNHYNNSFTLLEQFEKYFEKPYIINNRYLIIELLGEGGFGIVFKVFDTHTNNFNALKIITTFENSFEKEIEIVTKFNKHLNILEYYDYGFIQYKENLYFPFIVMELCDYSLDFKLFQNFDEFSLQLKLNLFLQICEGVEHLHLNNIIHRDLKPENALIKIDKVNKKEIIKIVDFGTAKQQKRKGTMTINIGTWNYMAPELFYENKEILETIKKEEQLFTIDYALDIYSLGCTFFVLITKKKLEYRYNKFYEMLKDERKEKKLHGYLCDVITIVLQNENKKLIEILQRIIISMLQRNPLKRPKITMIIDIIKLILQNYNQLNSLKLTNEQSEALLPLKDFSEELIIEKDKLIQTLKKQLKELKVECEKKDKKIKELEKIIKKNNFK